MAKKLKKKKTGMNPKVKFTLVNAGKGIISNQCVIDGSKESPWWVAAIFFAVSLILPLIPNFVKVSKTTGSDFISSVNYGLDTSLSRTVYELKQGGQDFVVEGGSLSYSGGFVTPDDTYFETANQELKVVTSDQFDLRIFAWKGLTNSQLSKYSKLVAKQQFKIGTTTLKSDTDPDGTTYYTPNIIIFTPKTFAVALYKKDMTKQAAVSYEGLDWAHTKGSLVGRMLKDVEGIAFDGTTDDKYEFIHNYRESVLKQFKSICNEAYLNQKVKTKWANTGIYAGIYGGTIIFLGLMLFVLTRGKKNPFRYLNVWHTQKIAWWAAFTPAVLGMILAFVFSGNMIGQMAFILLLSLRIMWMSMRQLRPVIPQ